MAVLAPRIIDCFFLVDQVSYQLFSLDRGYIYSLLDYVKLAIASIACLKKDYELDNTVV